MNFLQHKQLIVCEVAYNTHMHGHTPTSADNLIPTIIFVYCSIDFKI